MSSAFAADMQDTEDAPGKTPQQRTEEALAEIPPAPPIKEPTDSGFIVTRSAISAQVQTDAGMHASVQNSLKIGRNCNVFFWSIASLNGHSETTVNSVRIARIDDDGKMQGDWVSLSSSFFDADQRNALSKLNYKNASFAGSDTTEQANSGSWMFDSSENMLYAFFPSEAQTAATDTGANVNTATSAPDGPTNIVVDIDYTVANAVMAYEDVGEMYWYYLSGGNDMPVWNASAVIALPVPRGIAVEPGETVVAWGHGAPGIVDVQADGSIHYQAPYVAPGQYMMAHIVFPVSWLENISPETRWLHSGMRKAYAIEGEGLWTDINAANTTNFLAVNAACAGLCVIGVAIALALYFTRGREVAPSESALRSISEMSADQLRQRLYTETSPAVIARLMHNNRVSEADFTESLGYLIRIGAITVSEDAVPDRGAERPSATAGHDATRALSGTAIQYPRSDVADAILQQRHAPNVLETVRLHIGKNVKDSRLQPIEREILKVLFEDIADGYPALPVYDVHTYAEAKPARFAELMQGWQTLLDREVAAAGVFDPQGAKLRRGISIAAALYFVFGVAFGIAFASPIVAVCGIIAAIVMAIVAGKCARRTQKGTELALMAEALQTREREAADTTGAASPTEPSPADSVASPQPPSPRFPSAAFTNMLETDLATAYKHA